MFKVPLVGKLVEGKFLPNGSAGHRVMQIIKNQPLVTMKINNKFHVNLASSRQYIFLWTIALNG